MWRSRGGFMCGVRSEGEGEGKWGGGGSEAGRCKKLVACGPNMYEWGLLHRDEESETMEIEKLLSNWSY